MDCSWGTYRMKAFRLPLISFIAICFIHASGECQPTFVLEWGSLGIGDGQFSGPHGIVVGANGDVLVVDTGNNRVQKFASDGTFLLKWGSFGNGVGQFNHPHGIGLDTNGNVFVAETGNNRVQKFTGNGTFITMWGSVGDGDGQFRHTHGLAVDATANVYVAEGTPRRWLRNRQPARARALRGWRRWSAACRSSATRRR